MAVNHSTPAATRGPARTKATAPLAVTLLPHEARRLATNGEVLIVREVPQAADPNAFLHVYADGDVRWATEKQFHSCLLGPAGTILVGLEEWAVEGEWSDQTDDRTIGINTTHYLFWTRAQCFDQGKERFNTRWLGRWRPAATMPWSVSRLPRLRHESCEVKRADALTFDDLAAMGLPDGPDRIVKPGSSPIEYIEIKPADMVAQLHGIPADRWAWCSLVRNVDGAEVANA